MGKACRRKDDQKNRVPKRRISEIEGGVKMGPARKSLPQRFDLSFHRRFRWMEDFFVILLLLLFKFGQLDLRVKTQRVISFEFKSLIYYLMDRNLRRVHGIDIVILINILSSMARLRHA